MILKWAKRTLGAIVAVFAALLLDPTGSIAAIGTTLIAQSGALSSVTAIFGSQLAPRMEFLAPYARPLQILSVLFGVAFAVQQLDKVWDALKRRVLN